MRRLANQKHLAHHRDGHGSSLAALFTIDGKLSRSAIRHDWQSQGTEHPLVVFTVSEYDEALAAKLKLNSILVELPEPTLTEIPLFE